MDFTKVVEAIVETVTPLPAVQYTIVVKRDGRELARTSNWIVNEDQARKVFLADLPEVEYQKGLYPRLGKGDLADPGRTPIVVNGR